MEGWITNLSGIFDGYEFHEGPIHLEVQNQKITNIEKTTPIKSQLDGRGLILSPGLVDGHTHLIFGGTRFRELSFKLSGLSYSDILKRGGGIQSTVKATRETSVNVLTKLVSERCDVMLSHGTTRVEAKSGYGLEHRKEIELLEILNSVNSKHRMEIHTTFGAAHVFPEDMSQEAYIDSIIDEMLPEVILRNLASSTDVFCDRGAFDKDQTLNILNSASKQGHQLKIHAEELMYTGIAQEASRRFDLLSADHLLQATNSDFMSLEQNNTVAMFMPMAPFGLFTNDLPKGYKETNVTIGLGSDFNPNNWTVSMQTAIRFAVFRYRLSPLEAMRAATSGSYQGITGNIFPTLGIGQPADFILLKARSLEEFSSKFGQNLVKKVFKNGSIIQDNKHIIG